LTVPMDMVPISGQGSGDLAVDQVPIGLEEGADGLRQEEAAGGFMDMGGTTEDMEHTTEDFTKDMVMEGDLAEAGWEDITICVSEEGAGTGSRPYPLRF